LIQKFITSIFLLVFIVTTHATAWGKPVQLQDFQIKTLGIPVKAVTHVILKIGPDRQGNPQIYAAMAQQADNFIFLVINPKTGEFRQFVPKIAGSNYPNTPFMSKTGRIYIGAANSGHLFCFDPLKEQLIDCGLIHPGSSFPCSIDEDAQGRIWIGSYGDADLTRYDPVTGNFTHYGRMDEVDMYNYPMVNADGMICNNIKKSAINIII